MPKTKTQKEAIISSLTDKLAKQKGIVFLDYKGLGVKEMTELRTKTKEVQGNLTVAKKTLLSRVLKEKGIEVNLKDMEGQIAVVFSYEDPITPLQSVYAFSKAHGSLKILGGYLEKKVQSAADMIAIAQLPSKQELLAKVVGSVAAPMSGLVRVLNGNIKGLVIALNAMSQK